MHSGCWENLHIDCQFMGNRFLGIKQSVAHHQLMHPWTAVAGDVSVWCWWSSCYVPAPFYVVHINLSLPKSQVLFSWFHRWEIWSLTLAQVLDTTRKWKKKYLSGVTSVNTSLQRLNEWIGERQRPSKGFWMLDMLLSWKASSCLHRVLCLLLTLLLPEVRDPERQVVGDDCLEVCGAQSHGNL